MGVIATYDAAAAKVELAVTGLHASTAAVLVERFDTSVLTGGTVVRGGDIDPATPASFTLDDREFETGVQLTYRVRSFSGGGGVLNTFTATITPALTQVWLRSPTRPFLDRPVTVTDFSELSRPARGAVFDVLGRAKPVAVTDVRGSRRYTLTLRAADAEEAAALDLFLSFGDVVFVHVPGGCVVPASMHAFVEALTAVRRGRHDTEVRYFALPLVEVDAPDPSIIGYTITWAGVVSAWATWTALLADVDVPTWGDLLEYVSSPGDEVVS